jgi:TPP-dependent pyruvate/acetoin dehydrogenase alpha subunit
LYRTKEEENFWRGKDPIEVLAKTMIDESAAAESEVASCRESVYNEVRDAFQWAVELPEPSTDTLLQGVFS